MQLGSDFCIGSQLGSHQLPHVCKQSDATEQLTSSKENKGRRGREMGRPKLENALTNAEKKKRWREKNKENKDETEKEKDRQRKSKKSSKITNKEKENQRERNKEYKRKSLANRSYQKVLGTRLKDRNRKQSDKVTPKRKRKTSNSCKHYSTPRVQQYRERKKSQNSPFHVKSNFKMPLRNLSTTTRNKVREITDDINWLKSPSKKAVAIRTVVNSQSQEFCSSNAGRCDELTIR